MKCFARKLIRPFGTVRTEDIQTELRALDKLCKSGHPHIVQVLRNGSLNSEVQLYFIDMELCDFNLEQYANGRENNGGLVRWDHLHKNGELYYSICLIGEQLKG